MKMPPHDIPWWVLPSLAAAVLAVFATALIASFFGSDQTLQTTMFTGAYGLANAAVGYFFGSSNGSQKKDATIAAAASLAVPAATVTTTSTDPAGETVTTTATDLSGTPPPAMTRE